MARNKRRKATVNSWSRKLWGLLDLSDNIRKSQSVTAGIARGSALPLLLVFILVTFALTGPVLVFDIIPTHNWAQANVPFFIDRIVPFFNGFRDTPLSVEMVARLGIAAIVASTLLPTAVEMVSGRLTQQGLTIFSVVGWGFLIFDWFTDMPEVERYLLLYSGWFDRLPGELLGKVLFHLAVVVGTFLASVVIEVAWITSITICLLLMNVIIRRHRPRIRRNRRDTDKDESNHSYQPDRTAQPRPLSMQVNERTAIYEETHRPTSVRRTPRQRLNQQSPPRH